MSQCCGASSPGCYRALVTAAFWLCELAMWSGGEVCVMLPFLHIFSVRHLTAFLCLGTADSTLALHLGGILDSEITKKKAQKCKRKCGTKQTVERTLVCSTRVETRRQSNNLTTAGSVYKFFSNSSPLCTCSQMT